MKSDGKSESADAIAFGVSDPAFSAASGPAVDMDIEVYELLNIASMAGHRPTSYAIRNRLSMDNLLDGFIIGQQGHWRNLHTVVDGLRRQGDPDRQVDYAWGVPTGYLNHSLGLTMPGLERSGLLGQPLEALADNHKELSAFEARLRSLEAKLSGFDEPGTRSEITKSDTNRTEAMEAGREGSVKTKETDVRPALVNVASIASKVNACTTDTLPVWKEISRQFPGASLFAIDADPRSFEVLEKGHFDGRANVLISVPGQLRSGRNAERSFKIPTVVRGELSPTGEISISDISLSTQLH